MLADFVLVVHAAFVLFVVAGGALVLRWPRVAWAHVPAAAWGAGIEFVGGMCPLTPLEARLRAAAGVPPLAGDFIERALSPILYPGWLTREIQLLLGVFVVIVNGAFYAAAWNAREKKRQCLRHATDADGR